MLTRPKEGPETLAAPATRPAAEEASLVPKPPRALRDFVRGEGGVVYTEYVVIVLLVGIGVSAALFTVGAPLLRAYRITQAFLGAPLP